MLVSYVVSRCGWKPAYDIRIFNNDGTMKIVYYGMVQQSTGEDWETRYMTLSTAQPGIGGTVPHLGVQRVHFRRDHSPAIPVSRNAISGSGGVAAGSGGGGGASGLTGAAATTHQIASASLTGGTSATGKNARSCAKLGGFRRCNRTATTSLNETDRGSVDNERDGITPVGTLQRGGSTENAYATGLRTSNTRQISRRTLGSSMLFNSVNSPSPLLANRTSVLMNSQSTLVPTNPSPSAPPVGTVATLQLEVPRPPTLIRCDNEPNRVTVGLLDLQPRYEYVTVPKRSLHAYLKATAVNNTEFSILAGPTNIYADNTFIGKSEIRAVAPGEEFSCHLGAENGVKILYRPLYKYREGTGSGGKNATMTFKQLIEVRNTFDRRIRLMVVDQVPVSAEDKIKVSLLEPTIKHPEKYDRNKPIRMNKFNNVEWDLDLGPGEIRELTLKYSVEHPINEDLDVSVSET
ncbi:unnamed protein product [Heterobilharzia americana]|nr:unnamed protein product [Heterobilharzia americana]